MRVTKAIREYVEEQIKDKYWPVIHNVGVEYSREREAVENELQKILDDANEKAEAYLQRVGYICTSYRDPCPAFTMRGRVCNQAIENEHAKLRSEWEQKRDAKIKQVLFDLEMGETAKAELKSVLDNIVVE